MLNPNLINPKDLADKVAGIPQNKKDFLASPNFIAKLSQIQKKNNLLEAANQQEMLEQLIVLLIAGFFPPKELSENLEEFLHMEHDPALALEQDVLDLLKPILPSQTLTPTFAPTNASPIPSVPKFVAPLRPSTPPVTPPAPTPAIPKEGTFIKPTQTLRAPTQESSKIPETAPAPFIIHERSEVKPTINQPSTGATRQTFIRPQFTPARDASPPPVARVQAGGAVFGKQDIAPKVVNYSAPREPEAKPKPQTLRPAFAGKPQKTEEDANTINLRDLPK